MSRASEPNVLPRSVPISEYVLKVASRCNLACDYCYVYTMPDQSWHSRPPLIAPRTVAAAARRIGEHASAHGQADATVVLHGGEPLLAGPQRLDRLAGMIRREIPEGTALHLRVQTNGTLLDAAMLDVLRRHGIRVGISLDGGRRQHDRHRKTPGGGGSHEATTRALRLLDRAGDRELFAGLLCVVELDNDPVAVYESLLEFAPPVMDFLLPHGNWSEPPPGRRPGSSDTPYADWLIAVFDRWYSAARQETAVRLFQEIINLLLGGQSRTDQVGTAPVAFLVIDTDGSFQQADTLKSTHPGAPDTGLNVFEHTVDSVLRHPEVHARQTGIAALADDCRRCPIVHVCGGGNYAHRYRAGHGFQHQSVYCRDLTALITHIAGRVRTDLVRLAAR